MKPLPLLLTFVFLCFLAAFIVPQLIRIQLSKTSSLPVSVTALGTAEMVQNNSAAVLDLPSSLDTEENIVGYPGLTDFAARLITGDPNQLVGVYVPGLMALPVHQQPTGQPDFVDRDQNVITQFSLPSKYGSTGLLAHNYLSGSRFFQLRSKDDVVLIYGDGRLEHYRISRIESFQALKPNSPFSDFLDLSNPSGSVLSSADLFNRVYTTSHQLVFQTCIDNDGEPSWGRRFVIATLAEPLRLNVPSISELISSN